MSAFHERFTLGGTRLDGSLPRFALGGGSGAGTPPGAGPHGERSLLTLGKVEVEENRRAGVEEEAAQTYHIQVRVRCCGRVRTRAVCVCACSLGIPRSAGC
jgi:hypothetical protein